MQNASDVLYELIGVQFGDVTIVIPDHWQINADSFNEPNVKAAQSQPLESGDIIYTGNVDCRTLETHTHSMLMMICGDIL